MAPVTLEWAIAKIAHQAKEIEELNHCIELLEREVSGQINTAELSLLPDEFHDGSDPLNTGTFRALAHARSRK